ncbi:MAG: DUF2461 domain-containing protein [Anaerolineae bacterium]|nr:DUF2461 domain-containing protein [Anaerolineae bacterium]
MPANLQAALTFLEDLRFNNNREWFTANRKRYDEARAAFEALVADVMAQFAPLENLGKTAVKDTIYRINRDVRFTKDKSPYKTNFGALIGNGGRKSTGRTYYINIEPGESFIAGGVYDPEPEDLKRIRAAIAEKPDRLQKIIGNKDFVRTFGELRGDALKTAPKGYASDHPAIDLLKRKQFLALHLLSDDDVLKDDLAAHIIEVCKVLKPFEGYFVELVGKSS